MRLSHFCEKARWALDRAQVPYEEQSHAPLLHRIFTFRHNGATVPVLLLGSEVVAESSGILSYSDAFCGGGLLYPQDDGQKHEVEHWEAYFDRDLGPHVRRWLYGNLLPHKKLLVRLWSDGVPPLEARLVPAVLPIARILIRRGYKITPNGIAQSLKKIEDVFARVGDCLGDDREFLVGNRFTAADLTFAALSAPLLLPPQCPAAMPTSVSMPVDVMEQLLPFQESKAGKFTLRLYEKERLPSEEMGVIEAQ